ncbi:endonuclease/exonuclease/phosphatase family protein [Nocardiopsis rhodophaea]|uniref:Endonuclease/exonuclease/phosphatase family protein n=1 Tax=Nocardiopsis rhodophaea TaxID=280238 RepID=A0ABN2TLR4_9ACTN
MHTTTRPAPARGRARRRGHRRPPARGRAVGAGAGVAALAAAALLIGHRLVPEPVGSFLDTGLPWLGAPIAVLAAVAATARSGAGAIAAAAALACWGAVFAPALLAGPADAVSPGLRVASVNLRAGNPDPCAALGVLAARGADLIAAQEMTGAASACPTGLKYSTAAGTVGLWSRFPLEVSEPVDVGIGWRRALRAEVATPQGPVTVYAAHLASLRPGNTAQRNASLRRLARAATGSGAERVLVLGDFNTAGTDRRLGAFAGFTDAQDEAGRGLGFTWPASVPLVRLDHAMARGLRAVRAGVVEVPGSDHRAITAAYAR